MCYPYGAVKEIASGLYAQTISQHCFVTMTFDLSYIGESGESPRYVSSPGINTEDYSAADYLSALDEADAERMGIIGICGWGGYALKEALINSKGD